MWTSRKPMPEDDTVYTLTFNQNSLQMSGPIKQLGLFHSVEGAKREADLDRCHLPENQHYEWAQDWQSTADGEAWWRRLDTSDNLPKQRYVIRLERIQP